MPLLIPSTTVFDKPFKDETKDSIRVGITTKEDVTNVLGSPNATRQNESIYVYAKPYIYMKFLILGDPIKGFTRVSDFQTDHLLIVQFDRNGIVKAMDHIVGNGSETQNGIYVADTGLRENIKVYYGYAKEPPTYSSVEHMLVLYSPNDIEANAKQFLVPSGKSAIYAYCEPDYLRLFKPESSTLKAIVSLDNRVLGDFGTDGFFYWIVDPGSHSIEVRFNYPLPQKPYPDALTIECLEGQISFVELTWETKWRIALRPEHHAHLNLISDSNKGHQEILKRRMILDVLTPID